MLQALLGGPVGSFAGGIAAQSGGAHGVVGFTDMQVVQHAGTPAMNVDVGAGLAFVRGTEASYQGVYQVVNDATVTVTISAADATNARKDLIVARIKDAGYSGGSNAFSIEVVTGTPAASPADPAVPVDCLVLARVNVAALASSILNANITDLRTYAGQIGSIPTTSAAHPTAIRPGHKIYDTDTAQELIWNGSVWVCQTPQGATVQTSQSTTSASYTDLATGGPAVTVLTGTKAIVTVGAQILSSLSGHAAMMSFAVSGATTLAAADANAAQYQAWANNAYGQLSFQVYLTGLTAGSNTFTAKYRSDNAAATAQFAYRYISVIALP